MENKPKKLSKSVRKYIRTKKAEISKRTSNKKEQKKLVKDLYTKFA